MIETSAEAIEQNQRLVHEIFGVSQELAKSQFKVFELEKALAQTDKPGPAKCSSDSAELARKLGNAEAKIKNLDEINVKLFRAIKEETAKHVLTAKHAKDEALILNNKVEALHETLRKTESELLELQIQKDKNKNHPKIHETFAKIQELEDRLKEKEIRMAMTTTEMTEKDKILQDACDRINKLIQSQNTIFQYSSKLSSQAKVKENWSSDVEKEMKLRLAEMTNDLNNAKSENHRLAVMFTNEANQKRELETKVLSLVSQLAAVKINPACHENQPMAGTNGNPTVNSNQSMVNERVAQMFQQMERIKMEMQMMKESNSSSKP